MIVVAAVVVVALAFGAWRSLRPAWQRSSIASDLRSIDGVETVREPRGDRPPSFRVTLDDSASPRALTAAVAKIRATLGGRRVGGDDARAVVRLAGFELDDVPRQSVSENVVRTAVALRHLDGVTRVRADETFLDLTTASHDDVLPRAAEAIAALGSARTYARSTLRVRSEDDGTTVSASVVGAKDEAATLRRVADVMDRAGVRLAPGDDAGAGVRLFGGDDAVDCSVEVLLEQPRRLHEVARTVADAGRTCRTRITTSDDRRMVTVASGRAGVERAWRLLEELEGAGVRSVGVSSDLRSLSGSVADGRGLLALRDLAASARWPLRQDALLTITWRGTTWLALDDKTNQVLQRYAIGLARLRDAGFVASLADRTGEGTGTLTVSDDVEGAPDLNDRDGREAMVRAIRASGLPGRMTFSILNHQAYNSVAFTATTDGAARDVQLPDRGNEVEGADPTEWAKDLVGLWDSTRP